MGYISVAITILLVGYMIWKDMYFIRYLRENTPRQTSIKVLKDKDKNIPPITVDKTQYMTEEAYDQLLREELGEEQYRQYVSDQNYGMVG